MDLASRAREWKLAKPEKPEKHAPKWQERAERWASGLAAGTWANRAALARAEGVSRAYVTQTLGRLNTATAAKE